MMERLGLPKQLQLRSGRAIGGQERGYGRMGVGQHLPPVDDGQTVLFDEEEVAQPLAQPPQRSRALRGDPHSVVPLSPIAHIDLKGRLAHAGTNKTALESLDGAPAHWAFPPSLEMANNARSTERVAAAGGQEHVACSVKGFSLA